MLSIVNDYHKDNLTWVHLSLKYSLIYVYIQVVGI